MTQNLNNPFSLDTVRLPVERIVDRFSQVDFLNEHVVENRENVLVLGRFGIGKTCLLRKFRAELRKDIAANTLIIEMEMRRVTADASDFLSDVLLQLLSVFWSQVLKRPFRELLQAVTSPAEFRDRLMPQVARVLELYRLTRPKNVVADFQKQTTTGVEKIIRATRDESVSHKIERGDLTASEFIGLASEILTALQEHGIERTLIFGDEANHIDPDIETEIIRRNFEVFSHKNVQFILTAQDQIIERVPRLRDAFPACLEVRSFEGPNILDDLLSVYSDGGNVPQFSRRSRELIWRLSDGSPREIQRLCRECASIAIARAKSGGGSEVDVDVLAEAIADEYVSLRRSK